ncbi:heterokaryon incompatibility protein-domain-containing protein [Fennellomyces sp. T-0311]|nr:heterokaryon incompatibility protein-domain-containing protein [Fennellomyces sp. T-0311]
MPFTYDTKKWGIDDFYESTLAPKPRIELVHYPYAEEGSFKPTNLVRTSDMQVVSGEEANQPYCALSYCWSQSGEIIKDEKDKERRANDGAEHKIITHKLFFRHEHHVKFEDIIQQTCKDFGIDYIWYDQMCIDQNDKEQKQCEIQQMHKIYSNSACVVVLLPEFQAETKGRANLASVGHAEWFKRTWTLSEAFMGRQHPLLVVGRDIYAWSRAQLWGYPRFGDAANFLSGMYSRESMFFELNAAIILLRARKRTTTLPHDHYFALANMLPDKMSDLSLTYDQPLEDLAAQFYERLAKDDLSILYFGMAYDPDEEQARIMRTEDDKLPSWTGVHGLHIRDLFDYENDDGYTPKIDCHSDYSVTGSTMHITSTSIPVSIERDGGQSQDYELWKLEKIERHSLPVRTSKHLTFVRTFDEYGTVHHYTSYYGLKSTHFLPLKKEDGVVINTSSSPDLYGGQLSLVEECSEGIILSGVSYRSSFGKFTDRYMIRNVVISPVIRKDDDHYKAIGLCFLPADAEFSDIDITTKQTFVVK